MGFLIVGHGHGLGVELHSFPKPDAQKASVASVRNFFMMFVSFGGIILLFFLFFNKEVNTNIFALEKWSTDLSWMVYGGISWR